MRYLLLPIILLFASCQSEKTYPVGTIETRLGMIFFWLHEETPNHKQSFLELADSSYWDSLTFNRVIPGFVAQGGCPDTPEGFGDSPYLLEPEFKDSLKHIYGAVGAGRDDNPGKLSAGCQFYIVQDREGIPRLDGDYTIFGQVFEGMDVIDSIVALPRDSIDAPLEPVPLKVYITEMTASQLKEKGYDL